MRILNRGIAGNTSAGVPNRLDEVIERPPKIVALMIGRNDPHAGRPVSAEDANIREVARNLKQKNIRVVLHTVIYANANYRLNANNHVSELKQPAA